MQDQFHEFDTFPVGVAISIVANQNCNTNYKLSVSDPFAKDPFEKNNLANQNPELSRRLKTKLDNWRKSLK